MAAATVPRGFLVLFWVVLGWNLGPPCAPQPLTTEPHPVPLGRFDSHLTSEETEAHKVEVKVLVSDGRPVLLRAPQLSPQPAGHPAQSSPASVSAMNAERLGTLVCPLVSWVFSPLK
jgi:hypothetical protein